MDTVRLIVVGDVIRSRKKFDPTEWEHFHDSIQKVNKEFESSLTIPLTIYSGDSFGCICENIVSAVQIVLALQKHQKFHKTRIVLIEDEVIYGLDKKSFLDLTGPALWKSQIELANLKKTYSFFSSHIKNNLQNRVINTIVSLILSIRDGWNDLEWEVYRNYRSEITQKELAQKTGVSQQ